MTTRRPLRTLLVLFTTGSTLAANACSSSSDDVFGADGENGDAGASNQGAPDAGTVAAGGETSGSLPPSGIACASHGDCSVPWPYCDSAGGECVQCLTDTNCGAGSCDPATHSCGAGAPTTSTPPATTGGFGFPGAGGFAGVPLQPGFGPETADACPSLASGTTQTTVRDTATLCFYAPDDPTPAATIEQVIEAVGDAEYVHLRVTFNPTFADNTYGANSVGWGDTKEGSRAFDKLVGSDHLELLLTDCSGATVMQFQVDYVSEDADSPSGYGTLGVTGGDGKMETGDAADILAAATSIDRNLNGCGYGDYVVDSPSTDESFAPNPDTPNWDYRVVYEVWVDAVAFEQCFGQAYVESVHASPAKGGENTLTVEGGPCPPDWDTPYCVSAGEGCSSNVPDGGSPCPPNYTPHADCPTECVPIPFAGYPDRAACPAGWTLDLASEGRYCVPEGGELCP